MGKNTREEAARTPMEARVASRILDEGYGPEAWHGSNLRMALARLTEDAAFRRPAPGRHNIAEIALHHAWVIRSVAELLSGQKPEAFPLKGEDWFEADGDGLDWPAIRSLLDRHHRMLTRIVAKIDDGRLTSPLSESERFDLLLGVTCHAVYHAGQVQLIKVLASA